MKIRNSFLFICISVIFIIILYLIQLILSSNQSLISKEEKSLDYFKTTVNWSQYPIIDKVTKNHILVLGEARSGTSFLADLIHQSWPTFYAFEPLFLMKGQNIRDNQTNSERAIRILSKIFKCDFQQLNNFAITLWKNERNFVIQKYPNMRKKLVWNKPINKFVCQRCANILIKSIRISVKQFIDLQRKLEIPIKLVFIVRDPRGVISSRYLPSMDWCRSDRECSEIHTLCQRMKDDLNELVKYEAKFPASVSLIRFEDLSLETMRIGRSLFKKLGLEFNLEIENWIKRHTNDSKHSGDPYSTARMSRNVPFSWTNRLNSTQVNEIQEKCLQVMNILGYNLIKLNNSKNNLVKLDPIDKILRNNYELDYLTIK